MHRIRAALLALLALVALLLAACTEGHTTPGTPEPFSEPTPFEVELQPQ